MNDKTVKRLLNEYDEWHEAYVVDQHIVGSHPGLTTPEVIRIETEWRACRMKLYNHLLNTPGQRGLKHTPFFKEQSEGAARSQIIVNEEADTRKQEL